MTGLMGPLVLRPRELFHVLLWGSKWPGHCEWRAGRSFSSEQRRRWVRVVVICMQRVLLPSSKDDEVLC